MAVAVTPAAGGFALAVLCIGGCASPPAGPSAPRTEEFAPRFVAGGPDAEMYGAAVL